MRRDQFDHVVAAAANITDEDEFVVIGSQAILGPLPDPPAAMTASMEVDFYPLYAPEKADLIDAELGDGSRFHSTFGYYGHGVGPGTVKAPQGWEDRLQRVPIPPRLVSDRHPVALCLEIHDLVLAKCAALRDRDFDYARAAITAGLVDMATIRARIPTMPVPDETRRLIEARLSAFAKGRPSPDEPRS